MRSTSQDLAGRPAVCQWECWGGGGGEEIAPIKGASAISSPGGSALALSASIGSSSITCHPI